MTKLKRMFSAVIVLCMLTVLVPTAIAENPYEGSCGKNLTWKYDEATKTLTISGTGNMSNYYLSSTAGSRAPWVNSEIKDKIETVVISDGATSIGEYAFVDCGNLKTVTIPNSVKSIGTGAFFDCYVAEGDLEKVPEIGLESIVIPNGVETIGDYAFYNCRKLSTITIPESVTKIGDSAFQYCFNLKEVTIPGNVQSIGEYAFANCYVDEFKEESGTESGTENSSEDEPKIIPESGLEKVTIQEGVETIGGYAFYMCQKLNKITLPDSVKSIGYWAFYDTGCYNDWDGNDDVLYINNHLITVYHEKSTPCEIKSGTKTIADSAFFACRDLPNITIPDTVVSIGKHAFDNCNSLKSITIPKKVTSIGNEAFYSCFDLASITVDPDNPAYCSESGVLYSKEKTEIIRFPKEKAGDSFAIPTGVTSIADGAFEYCPNLKSVTIPDGVTSIGNRAFENCYFATYKNYKIVSEIGLEKVAIPDSVTSIGDRAFLNCSKLTGIKIPDGVVKIGESTFNNCSKLTDITIPNSVLIIDKDAFTDCTNLKTVYYVGSETDWNEVKGNGKYVLTNIGIKHLSGISAKRSDDGKSIVVKPINVATGKIIILALYDGDKFVEMKQSSKYSDGNREITFTSTKSYTRAKVMIWNSLGEMSPVCDFKIIE